MEDLEPGSALAALHVRHQLHFYPREQARLQHERRGRLGIAGQIREDLFGKQSENIRVKLSDVTYF